MQSIPTIVEESIRRPLPLAIPGGRHHLSAQATQEILALAHPAPARFLFQRAQTQEVV